MEIRKRRVFIQLELAFDIWSLFFGITRQAVAHSLNPQSLSNKDYLKIMNVTLETSLSKLEMAFNLNEREKQVIE